MRSRSCHCRYESIFEYVLAGILYTDVRGKIIEANPALCAMLGYTVSELLALTTDLLVHPEDKARHCELNLELANGVRTSLIEYERYLQKNGTLLECRRSVSLIKEASGDTRFIHLIENISERKQNDERFRETFDYASVGIMHSSLDRRVLIVNRKFCEMVGYRAEELQDGSVARIHHPADSDADQALERRLLAGDIESFSFDK